MAPVCGGVGEFQDITDDVKAIVMQLKPEIEQALSEKFEVFEPKTFATQVVAGTNFVISISIGNDKQVLAKVHKPLSHTGQPPTLMNASRA